MAEEKKTNQTEQADAQAKKRQSNIHLDETGYADIDKDSAADGQWGAIKKTLGETGSGKKAADKASKALNGKGKTLFKLMMVYSVFDGIRTKGDMKRMRKVNKELKEANERMNQGGPARSDTYGAVFSDAFQRAFDRSSTKSMEKELELLQIRKEKRDARKQKLGGLVAMAMGIGQAARTESMKSIAEQMTGQQGGIRDVDMADIGGAEPEAEPELG